MAKDEQSGGEPEPREEEGAEAAELLLFQTNECYVYMIPPRKSSASYRNHTGMKPFKNTLKATIVYRRGHTIEGKRCEVSSGADEWNVNKWAWEGILRVISKGEECMVKLEDKNTGELYAQAFVRRGQPLPVEPVIDSSRYFALCIEENFGGRTRHAFIGIGFRERPEAYDFQAALYDHVKYLDKKQAAEEMEQQYQTKASIDYSLKEGQTLKLQLKKPEKGTGTRKSTFFEQELDKISSNESGDKCRPLPCLVPPPPPPAPSSPSATCYGLEKKLMPSLSSTMHTESTKSSTIDEGENEGLSKKNGEQDSFEDDFGDFQTAG